MDARYLVDRGYPKESSIRFVADHYRLPEAQRFVLIRVIVASAKALSRRTKLMPLEAVKGQDVFIDGYNVLIAVESILGDRPVYLCDDGLLRDAQGIFRSYKTSELTDPALSQILDLLAIANPSRTEIIFDQQISMSGSLAARVRVMMAERSLPGTAMTAKDVDHQLKIAKGVVATSDGNVIDAASRVIDLPLEIARRNCIDLLVL